MTQTTSPATHTAAYCKIMVPVWFNYGLSSQFALDKGSVVEWTPEDGDIIRIHAHGSSRTYCMDDAIPVEWDAKDEMWVEDF